MTFNILFLSITIGKRSYSSEEISREIEINKISDELLDRKCANQHHIGLKF